jgi:DNA-binding XRE family transcriptional regulator
VTGKCRALAERRRVVGYTQERLAEMLGVERTTVVRWEAGETCPQPWYRPKWTTRRSCHAYQDCFYRGARSEDTTDAV